MDLGRFHGSSVIVTGAAKGIGQACALRFAKEGANVACLDLLAEANQATAEACRSENNQTLALSCNVTDAASVEGAVKKVVEAWGRVDVLVASAGIYTGSPLSQVTDGEWQQTLDVNLTGVFLCNRSVAKYMIAQGAGSIINISSMAGKTSWPGSAQYSASKSGVIGLTRSVAMELAPHGATANAVCPGNTKTEMVERVASIVAPGTDMNPDEWLDTRRKDCPMMRFAEPWEIAGVVAFLASEDSRYLTGQAIEVDGGMILA
jgi:NAD(P)-dependent dehydrogenase (short-subunit alcohol dehydrogenase family)